MGWRAVIIYAIGFGLYVPELFAQQALKSDPLTIPALQKRIKSIQANTELTSPVKDAVVDFLQQAVVRIEISQEQNDKADKFEKRLSRVADLLATTTSRLAELPSSVDPDIANVGEIEELDRTVAARMKQLDDAENGLRKQVADLEAEAAQWRIRPEELINELSEIEERLREIDDEINALATNGETRELLQAHQLFLMSRRQRAISEKRAIEAESGWYESAAASNLLQAQQELASKTLALRIAELEFLQNELAKRRGDEADQRVHQAESVVAHVDESLKPLAEENLYLAKEQRDVTKRLREIEHQHEMTSKLLSELQKEFDRTQTMVDKVGLTDSIGLLLRQQRAKLLDRRSMRSNISRRNEVVRETRMRLFQLDADRTALVDLDAAAAKRAEELSSSNNHRSVAAGLRDLMIEQRQLYKDLEADHGKHFQLLTDMNYAERRLLDMTMKYAEYVDERVLWIRTGQTFGRNHLTKLTPSFRWISDSKLWKPVVETVWLDTAQHPVPWLLAAVLLTLWLGVRPILGGFIQQNGLVAAEINCRDLGPTLQTILFTLVMASGWPLLIWFLGWRLDHSATTIPFVHAVASGLLRAAVFALPLEVLRVICVRGGLAERHFDWPPQTVNAWRRNLNWFLPIGVILVGLIGLLEGTADEHRLDSFGRMTFLVFAALSAVFSQMTIRRARISSKTNEGVVANDTDVWSERFWRFAPSLAVTVCVGLFALTWTGYFYTSLQLTWRLQRTAWFAVGLLILRAGVRRWIALERRRMAILQDEELMSLAEAGRKPGNSDHNPFLFPRWNWPDFRLNLTQIVAQMRSLLDTGLITLAVLATWFVWADVIPALNILDRVTLWNTTIEQTVNQDDSKNGATVQTIRRPKRVTAANLGLAAIIVAIAVIAGRNIPGLVEVILLEHLSVDAGIRFAATCLVRYAIFIVGVSGALAQIGIGWSNIQWLVAAASVGLGFGLQEIFCNFISGIILLFERPMRVGDVITIGDTTGTVSRIRFRATTIVDGDRKELIVPNKEFITGKLLNWTLSDCVNRVGIKVVVGNNNDPQRIRRLLLEIASQQPQLLKDPAPTATLEELSGGLTFYLRAFLPTLDARSSAIHDLYTVIHHRFKEEGIEMPCPSQEVFIRMDRADGLPANPHQTPSGIPIKSTSTDFSPAFRRA